MATSINHIGYHYPALSEVGRSLLRESKHLSIKHILESNVVKSKDLTVDAFMSQNPKWESTHMCDALVALVSRLRKKDKDFIVIPTACSHNLEKVTGIAITYPDDEYANCRVSTWEDEYTIRAPIQHKRGKASYNDARETKRVAQAVKIVRECPRFNECDILFADVCNDYHNHHYFNVGAKRAWNIERPSFYKLTKEAILEELINNTVSGVPVSHSTMDTIIDLKDQIDAYNNSKNKNNIALLVRITGDARKAQILCGGIRAQYRYGGLHMDPTNMFKFNQDTVPDVIKRKVAVLNMQADGHCIDDIGFKIRDNLYVTFFTQPELLELGTPTGADYDAHI